jgi:nucleotide-binding universal stress UspA family protein
LTEARDRLLALAARRTRIKTETRIVLGDPAEEIAAQAAVSNAGLAVLILRRGRGLFGPRKGSITYRVLCSSATPVLALPAPL